MEENKIFFKGSVSSKGWPPEHAHHFKVIDQISLLRYGDYMVGKSDNKGLRDKIKKLRDEARELREEFDPNESAFRFTLETRVLERFAQEVQW